jgi:hypothetical protein
MNTADDHVIKSMALFAMEASSSPELKPLFARASSSTNLTSAGRR